MAEQALSITNFGYGKSTLFSCKTQQVILSIQDGGVLPARVANHSAGFWSILPLHKASHIIRHYIYITMWYFYVTSGEDIFNVLTAEATTNLLS